MSSSTMQTDREEAVCSAAPQISVVMPAYNRAECLHRALKSLVRQTFKDFEVIVCDDGSDEDLFSCVDAYSSDINITYIKIPNSGGPARPRNTAARAATAPWISLLDSDDWWDETRLERVVPELKDGVDVVYHRLAETLDENVANAPLKRMVGGAIGEDAFCDLLTLGNPIPNSAAMIRRTAFDLVDGFDEQRPLIEDYDLWVRLAAAGAKFIFLDECLGCYWMGGGNISTASFDNMRGLSAVFDKQLDARQLAFELPARSYLSYAHGVSASAQGEHALAVKYFIAADHLRLKAMRCKRIAHIVISGAMSVLERLGARRAR